MQTQQQKLMFGSGCVLLLTIPVWMWIVAPQLTKLPADFSYSADIISLDNFYDEQTNEFSGEKRSIAKFSLDVVGQNKDVLIAKNAFDVRTVTGEQIFTVNRLYGIDAKTGQHIAGAGDRDRDGYLFAPRRIKKGAPFNYWHINYDGPGNMTFVEEEIIDGLRLYRYETRYTGVRIDQTTNLSFLPEVGVARGIELEPYLQIWIEPLTGRLIRYKDDTVAYYYDLKTGTRLHPWNHFSNTFTTESVHRQIATAKRERLLHMLIETGVPVLLVFVGGAFLIAGWRKRLMIEWTATSILLIAGTMAALSHNATMPEPAAGPPETIHIGVEQGLLASAVWIAEHNGYFRDEGIDLRITPFPSGKAALASLLSDGKLDMATVAQTPIVFNSFSRDDYSILGGMVRTHNDLKILARRDKGIREPQDLRGKKIGVTKNSTGHYFLAMFLAQHGMTLQTVKTVDVEADGLSNALETGSVDAISTWEPHLYRAKRLLGDNVFAFESIGIFREDFYFVSRTSWAKENLRRIKKFLRAVVRANAFITEHPQETQSIIASKLDLEASFVESALKDFSYALFLDQAILLSLEQQAHWMMENKIVRVRDIPNYLRFFFFDPLDAVDPEAVTIIR